MKGVAKESCSTHAARKQRGKRNGGGEEYIRPGHPSEGPLTTGLRLLTTDELLSHSTDEFTVASCATMTLEPSKPMRLRGAF